MTAQNDFETVAAFIDGERVDTTDLKRALATEEGRNYLVELVAMREIMREDADTSTTTARPAAPRQMASAWWIASAAAVVLAVAGGFALGASRAPQTDVTTAQSAPAPAPTKVLKLETGVNWKENQSPKGGE